MTTAFSFSDLVFDADAEDVFGLGFEPIEESIPLIIDFETGFDIGGELGRVEVIPGFTIRLPFVPDIRVPPLVINFDTELSAELNFSGEFGVELGFNFDPGSIDSAFTFDAGGEAVNGFRGTPGLASDFVGGADGSATDGEFTTESFDANAFLDAIVRFAFDLDVEARLFGVDFLGGLLEDISFDTTTDTIFNELFAGLAEETAEDDDGNEILENDGNPIVEEEAGVLNIIAIGTDGLFLIENPSPFLLEQLFGFSGGFLAEANLGGVTFNAVLDPFTARIFIFTDDIAFNGEGLGSGRVPPFSVDVGELFVGFPEVQTEGEFNPTDGSLTADDAGTIARLGFDADLPVGFIINVLTAGLIPSGTGFNASLLDGLVDLDVDLLDIDTGPTLSLGQDFTVNPNDLILTLDFTDLDGNEVFLDAVVNGTTQTGVSSITLPYNDFPQLVLDDTIGSNGAVVATPTFALAPTLDNRTTLDLGLFLEFVIGGLEAALNNPINLGPDTLFEIDVSIFEREFDGADLIDALNNSFFNLDLVPLIEDALSDLGLAGAVQFNDQKGAFEIPLFDNEFELENFEGLDITGDPFVFDIEQSGRNGGFTGIDDGVNTNAPHVTRDDTFTIPNLGLGFEEDTVIVLSNEQLTANDFDLDAFDVLTVVEIGSVIGVDLADEFNNPTGDGIIDFTIENTGLVFLNEQGDLVIDADAFLDIFPEPNEGFNSAAFVVTQVVEDLVGNVGVGEIEFIVTGTNDIPIAFDDAVAESQPAFQPTSAVGVATVFSGLLDNDFDIDGSPVDVNGDPTIIPDDGAIPNDGLFIAERIEVQFGEGGPITTAGGGTVTFVPSTSLIEDSFTFEPSAAQATTIAALGPGDVFVDTFEYTLVDGIGLNDITDIPIADIVSADVATASIVVYGVDTTTEESTNPLIFAPPNQTVFEDSGFGSLYFVPGADPSGASADGTTTFELTFDNTELDIDLQDDIAGATKTENGGTTTINFSLGEAAFGVPILFDVQALEDDVIESIETSDVTLTATGSTETDSPFLPSGIGLTDTVQITIDELPRIVVSETEVTVTEGGATGSFDIQLSREPAPGTEVTIFVRNSDDTAATVSADEVTFDSSNFNVPQTITVTATDDNLIDGTQLSTVTLIVAASAAGADPAFATVPTETVELIALDDENQAPVGVADPNVDTDITFDTDGNAIVTQTQTVDISLDEDSGSIIIDVLANDFDPDTGDNTGLTVALLDGDGNDISPTAANGTVVVNPDQTLTYTPDPDFNGVDTITYAVTDGGVNPDGSPSIAFGIPALVTVNAVNDAPVLDDFTVSVSEDETITIDLDALIEDVDGDTVFTITETGRSTALDPSTVDITDGVLTFTPPADFFNATRFETDADGFEQPIPPELTGEAATLTLSIDDGGDNGEISTTIDFLITPVNDAPVAPALTDDVNENEQVTILASDILAGVTDVDNVAGEFTLTDVRAIGQNPGPDGVFGDPNDPGPDGEFDTADDDPFGQDDVPAGVATLDPDGNIVFTANGDFLDSLAVGETTTSLVTYTVEDPLGAEGQGTIEVTVTGVNDDPDAEDAAFQAFFNLLAGAITIQLNDFDLSDSASDIDGDVLTFAAASSDEGGTFEGDLQGAAITVNPNGTFGINVPITLAPALGTGLADTFEYVVDDGNGGTDTALAAVLIAGAIDFGQIQATDPGIVVSASQLFASPNATGNQVNLAIQEDSSAPLVIGLADVLEGGESVTLQISVNDPDGDGSIEAGQTQITEEPDGTETITEVDTFEITFEGGAQAPQIVDIEAFQDGLFENPELVTITVSVANDGTNDGRYGSVSDVTRTAEIVDAGALIVSDDLVNVTEGDAVEFTVSLGAQPIADSEVVVNVSLLNDDGSTTIVDTLTFTDINATSPQTVSIATIDDDVIEDPEFLTYLVSVDDDATTDPRFAFDASADPADTEFSQDRAVIAVVEDNDTPELELTFSSPTVAEDGTVTATVTRNGPTDDALEVALASFDLNEASVPSTVTIGAGQTSAEFTVAGVQDGVIDGDTTTTILAFGIRGDGAVLADFEPITVTDSGVGQDALIVDIPSSTVTEGNSVTGFVTRPDTDGDLIVTLTSEDDGQASVPITITIPNGETTAPFIVTGVEETEVDGAEPITITASVDPFFNLLDGFDFVTVIDNETTVELPTLTVSLDPDTIAEDGGTVTGTVTRSGDTTGALTVNLASDDTSEATVPLTVEIPDGEASVDFTVTVEDDDDVDGDQVAAITASASGFEDGSADLTVLDDDDAVTPTLSLSIDPTSFSENGGTATGTLTRTGDTSAALTVNLSSSDTGEATVPATAEFAVGSDTATFTVTGIDDSIVDGPQGVTITAGATGFSDTTGDITVTDDDGIPELTVTIDPSSISEDGGVATATVTRNTGTDGDLTVNLASTDTTEATVPASVLIPDGEDFATFEVTAVDDSDIDGDQIVTITAGATGFDSGADTVTVEDDDAITGSAFVFTLLDTDIDNQVLTFEDGDTIDASLAPAAEFRSIEVDLADPTLAAVDFGSIFFTLSDDSGTVLDTQLENIDPYVLTGNAGADFNDPTFDFANGTYTLEVTAFDANGGFNGPGDVIASEIITFTISDVVSTAPEIISLATATVEENQTFVIDVEAIDDADSEGAGLTFELTGTIDDALFSIDADTGVVTFDAPPDFETPLDDGADNTYDIQVTVTDSDDETDVQDIAITVTDVAVEVSTDGDEDIDLLENDAPVTGNIFDNFADANPATPAQVVAVLSGNTPVGLDIDFSTGDFTVAPDGLYDSLVAGQTATFGIDYTIDDGDGVQLDSTLTVTITGENDEPTDDDETVNLAAGETLVNALDNAADDDTGVDPTGSGSAAGDTLAISEVAGNAANVGQSVLASNGGMFTIDADGSVDFDPNGDFANVPVGVFVETSVSYTVSDGNGGEDESTYTVIVEGEAVVAEPTIISAATNTIAENESLAIDVLAVDDADSEGNGLTYSISGGPDASVFSIDASSGVVTFDAPPNAEAPDDVGGDNVYEFEVTVTDSDLLTDTQDITITVTDEDEFVFQFVDTLNDVELGAVTDGDTIDADALGVAPNARSLSADFIGDGVEDDDDGSIVLTLLDDTGATVINQTENLPLYILTGNNGPEFNDPSTPLVNGDYTLVVNAFAGNGGTGELLGTQSIDFSFGQAVDQLILEIDPTTISEDGGTATATITRTGNTAAPLTVALASSDTSEATVPTSVTIGADETSATFDVTIVDDTDVDGDQTATITASATGFADVEETITVTDDDVAATLSLSIDPDSFSENGGSATGTITRTGDLSQALTATLSSDDTTEATVPVSVTIDANQALATFGVAGVDDGVVDGDQDVIITASASGFADATDQVTVEDDDAPIGPITLSQIVDLDGEQFGNGAVDTTQTGNDNDLEIGGGDTAGLLFDDFEIPVGADIVAARLIVTSQRTQNNVDQDIEVGLFETTENLNFDGTGVLTGTFNLALIESLSGNFAAGEELSIDVTSIVDQLFDQSSSGNTDETYDFGFALSNDDGVFRINPNENGDELAAELQIDVVL